MKKLLKKELRLNVWVCVAANGLLFFILWMVSYKLSCKTAVEPSDKIAVDEFGADGPFQVIIGGKSFLVYATNNTFAQDVSYQVLEYDISKIEFQKGDVVFDVGANIGLFSILLAKANPFINIYAFEPEKKNFEYLEKNIKANNIENGVIIALNKAVNKDGENVTLFISRRSTRHTMVDVSDTHKKAMFDDELKEEIVEGMSLSQAFEKFHIEKCKLFKIDCEGCEYDALYYTEDKTLDKIEVFWGEFHDFKSLIDMGFNADKLYEHMKEKIEDIEVVFFNCFTEEKC